MRVHPFRALRPAPTFAARIASPPYDVVTRAEAAAIGAREPQSFIHVERAEIDLPDTVDPHDPRVYARARENLDGLRADGALVREAEPAVYLYREVMDGRAQTGVVACVHVDDYARGLIKKHERTRPDKEDDRTRHALAVGAHAEPVLLMYRDVPILDGLMGAAARETPLYDFVAPDGVAHTMWRLADPGPYVDAFAEVPAAYVADGHHRSASAWRVAREHGPQQSDDEIEWFPAVLFPASHLRILPYNRLVTDLHGQTPAQVIERLRERGRLSRAADPEPARPGSFGIYVGGEWWTLELDASTIDRRDPVSALDVSLLQERVLGPVLGIGDQRTDTRIDFVGGIRGAGALAARVDAGEMALAVALHPVTVAELMAVSDAGEMMPPKSTWFEPKLLSGLFVHEF